MFVVEAFQVFQLALILETEGFFIKLSLLWWCRSYKMMLRVSGPVCLWWGPSISFTFPFMVGVEFGVLLAIGVRHDIRSCLGRRLHINFASDQIKYFFIGFLELVFHIFILFLQLDILPANLSHFFPLFLHLFLQKHIFLNPALFLPAFSCPALIHETAFVVHSTHIFHIPFLDDVDFVYNIFFAYFVFLWSLSFVYLVSGLRIVYVGNSAFLIFCC